jgi:hypothetical protein
MRAPGLFERVSQSGQSFPNQSGAVFVVEVRDEFDALVPFPDAVNVAVEFIDTGINSTTDLVEYDGTLRSASQMRLTRDTLSGAGVNFATYTGGQTPNLGNSTVEALGITGLTDSSGIGIWGAVADPGQIPAELSILQQE